VPRITPVHITQKEFSPPGEERNTIHNFFVRENLTDNDKPLNDANSFEFTANRCNKCGYPLEIISEETRKDSLTTSKKKRSFLRPKTTKDNVCFACRREQILSLVLNATYVLFGGLFLAAFVSLFFRVMTPDLWLLIGCLEVIFLLFFGRFLEEAVFFGLTPREKVLATLYRFSITGELQNFDTAFSYLQKINQFDDETLKALLQVTAFQARELPTSWFLDLSKLLHVKPGAVVGFLSEQISVEHKDDSFIKSLFQNAPPAGVSLLLEIFLLTGNYFGLELVLHRLEEELAKEPMEKSWLEEFYLYKQNYQKALELLGRQDLNQAIAQKMVHYQEPKVPTIDVLESSKNFIQRNPFIRYIIRIMLYLLLAFLFGLFYKLLE